MWFIDEDDVPVSPILGMISQDLQRNEPYILVKSRVIKLLAKISDFRCMK
jgi:hypothetical protein